MSDVIDARHERDCELVGKARAGSAEAFSDLVDVHYASLLRHLTRLTGDREQASDLAQETFTAAFQSLDQLVEDRSFAAWLFQIGRNLWFMELRRRKRYRFLSFDWIFSHSQRMFARWHEPDPAVAYGKRDLIQQALNQ